MPLVTDKEKSARAPASVKKAGKKKRGDSFGEEEVNSTMREKKRGGGDN